MQTIESRLDQVERRQEALFYAAMRAVNQLADFIDRARLRSAAKHSLLRFVDHFAAALERADPAFTEVALIPPLATDILTESTSKRLAKYKRKQISKGVRT